MKHLGRVLAAVLLLVGVLVVSGRVRFEPVLTGSMAPRYPTGTLVAVTPITGNQVKVGDVIMFVPPKPWIQSPVLHRVVSISSTGLRTKGDANAALDPWTIDTHSPGLAQLRAGSVTAGRALALAKASLRGPGLVLWGGLGLLWLLAKRTQPDAARQYHPRHAA